MRRRPVQEGALIRVSPKSVSVGAEFRDASCDGTLDLIVDKYRQAIE